MADAIIIIKTIDMKGYEIARDDLKRQMKELGWDMPVFCHLFPTLDEGETIEVIWVDTDYDLKRFADMLKLQNQCTCHCCESGMWHDMDCPMRYSE